MKLHFQTKVEQGHQEVFAQFDKRLLQTLTPPGIKLRLIQFDEPTQVDGVVHIEVKILGLIRQEWYNVITEYKEGETESYFVDEGEKLPGMLKFWRHKHLIKEEKGQTLIIDDVEYKSRYLIMDWLLYPAFWMQFAYRKPKYRSFFKKKN